MNPLMGMGGAEEGTNLFSILINLAFGFVGGLMLFIGPQEIISYGSELAEKLIKLTGYGQQMAAFGFATSAAPYIVLAPIVGLVVKQLTGVRSIKGFAFFAAAVLVGVGVAFASKGYVLTLII